MTNAEFERWIAYHRDTPLDDEFRIYRPAALIAAVGAKDGKGLEFFMDAMVPSRSDYSDADAATLKAFGIPPRRK